MCSGGDEKLLNQMSELVWGGGAAGGCVGHPARPGGGQRWGSGWWQREVSLVEARRPQVIGIQQWKCETCMSLVVHGRQQS